MSYLLNLSSTSNDLDNLYITGDETTEDSIRFAIDDTKQIGRIEKLIQKVWQPSSLKTGPDSILLGLNVGLAAVGHHLGTEALDGLLHLHAHEDFNGEVTEVKTRILFASLFLSEVASQPDFSGEFTGTEINFAVTSTVHIITNESFWKTGAVPATDAVRIRTYEGTDATGLLIFDQSYPASQFPINSDVTTESDGYVEIEAGLSYFTRITSNRDFSLLTNAAVTRPYQAVDLSFVRYNHLLETPEFQTTTPYTIGDWFIDHDTDKIYEANVTGVQASTFADNSDKWDQLISVQGFDRILNSVDGNSIADISGNLVIGNL